MRPLERLCHLWDTWEGLKWETSIREPNLLCLRREKPSKLPWLPSTNSGVSFGVGHQADLLAVRVILAVWFDHLDKFF